MILPYSKKSEDIVIGGLLLNDSNAEKIKSFLSPDDFYFESNKIIFKEICHLIDSKESIHADKVFTLLEHNELLNKVGTEVTLYELANNTTDSEIDNIVVYAEIVRERSILRKLIQEGIEIPDFDCSSICKNKNISPNDTLLEQIVKGQMKVTE